MSRSIIKATNCIITSVEKGNVEKEDVLTPVCAFSVLNQDDNTKIKVLLKGNYAKRVWGSKLKNGFSLPKDDRFKSCNYNIELSEYTVVDLTGAIREVRKDGEIVVENPYELIFYNNTEFREVCDE